MKKVIIALLLATMAGALTFGAAASLGLTSQDLGAGRAPVESCDTDNVNVQWFGVSPYKVHLLDVDNRCDGQEAIFTVTQPDGHIDQFFFTVPVDPSTTVPVSTMVNGNPISNQAVFVDLYITGPAHS